MMAAALLLMLAAVGPPLSEAAPFLPQLDLSVVSFTPAARASLSGRDTLTATFNRAVIALGSDFGSEELPEDKVPFSVSLSQPGGGGGLSMEGRWRWVTTFVARFDPVDDWPTDVTVSVVLNTGLTTWDGVPLAAATAQEYVDLQFETPQVTMGVRTVRSAQAAVLTGDAWTAGYSDPREVPPDGVVELGFSRAVDPALVQAALRIELAADLASGSSPPPPIATDALVVATCSSAWRLDPSCVTVDITAELAVDTEYRLVLPAGSQYHTLCGSTQQEHALTISGLRPFRFPFRQAAIPEQEWSRFEPRASRYDLWLPHGLDSSTTLEQLQSAIDVSPAVDVRMVRHSLSVIRMEPASDGSGFQPDVRYTITVAASSDILDGFGLPLESSSSIFETAEPTGMFFEAGSWDSSAAVFPSHDPLTTSWDAVAKGNSHCHASWATKQEGCRGVSATDAYHIGGVNIGSIANVPSLLAALSNSESTFLSETATAHVDLTVGDSLQNLALPVDELFGESGLFLESMWNSGVSTRKRKQSRFVSQTNLAITFAQTAESKFTVWITYMSTNLPVPHLRCTLYKVPHSYNPQPQPSDVVAASSPVTTDADGLATVEVSDVDASSGNLYGVVEDLDSGGLAVINQLSLSSPSNIPVSAAIVTDRGVYKGGDVVHVKLWVRAQEGSEMVVPSAGYELAVQWTREEAAEPIPVQLDVTTGSFSIDLTVPEDAQYGDHSITLRPVLSEQAHYGYYPSIGQATVTVADPRPPTVLMSLKPLNDELVMSKSGSVDIEVMCETYAGTAVADQVVTVRWQHEGNAMVMPSSGAVLNAVEISGSFEVTSSSDDGSGVSTFALPAEAIEFVGAGDTITFSATWIGPTREVVNAETSIVVSESPWSLRLAVSPDQPLPGFEFGTTVDVQEYGSNEAQTDAEVEVSLYEAGETQAIASANGDLNVGSLVGDTCTMTAGGSLGCPMSLPSTGNFVLVSCVADPTGQQICASLELGKTAEEWQVNPLTTLADISMTPDQQSYSQGDTASFNFYCPFTDARALIVWGNRLTQQAAVSELVQGAQTLSVTIGEECIGGCKVTIVVSSPTQTSLPSLPVDLAVSSLFDISLPQRIVSQHTLNVMGESTRLEAAVTIDDAELTPGSSAGFTVELTDEYGAPVRGEVCLFAVDKAFLDVKPHPPQDLASSFELDLKPGYLSASSNTDTLVGGAKYDSSKARLASLSSKEPWLQLNFGMWATRPGESPAFDLAEDAYLSQTHSQFITEEPPVPGWGMGYYGGTAGGGGGSDEMEAMDGDFMMSASADSVSTMTRSAPAAAMADGDMMAAPPPPPPPPGGAPGAAAASQVNTPIRSAFETTPLFLPSVSVDSSGSVHINWDLPDNIGTFVIRAYAVGLGGKFGVATDAQQLARQPVSLIPSVPRLSRVGDEFTCGVTVTASDAAFDSDVTLSVNVESGGVILLTPASQTVAVDGTRPHEITFGFSAVSLEAANLVFSLAAGASNDALSAEIPVLSAQQPVSIATSMGITATQTAVPWMEGLQLPDAVPGSGSLGLLVGVGYLPAVRTISTALTSPAPCVDTSWCSGHDLISSMIALPCLEQYLSDSNSDVVSAQTVFDSSLALLETLTDSDGLRYSSRKYGDYVDINLNAYALYVVREIDARGGPSALPTAAPLVGMWRAALVRGLSEAVADAQTHGYTFRSWDSVARTRLALGAAAFAGVPVTAQATLSMASLTQQALSGDSCGSYCRAATAVALLRENAADASAATLLRRFADGLRVTGRTAYLSAAGSPHALDMGTQSLVLQGVLLCDSDPIPQLLLQKLSNYVAQGGGDTYGWQSRGADGVMRIVALSTYDESFGSNEPSIDFKARTGSTTLLAGEFTPEALGPLSSSTSWSALPRSPPPLVLWATGVGQLNVAASLRFEPSAMPTSPIYRGFYVQQVYRRLVNGEASGPPLRAVPLGSMVSVTLQVTTPDDIDSALRVESWLPGGLEPLLDLDAPSGAAGFENCGGGLSSRGAMYGWWWMCPRWERETMADRVTWYAGRGVRAGTFTLSFEAVAATVGRFALPPAQTLVVMQPEVMGLSAGGVFEVGAAGELSEEDMVLPLASAPNGCPADCSGQGVCDVVTGTCQCSAGAAGADCSGVAAPLTMELAVQQPDEPTLLTLVGLDADAVDWLGAVSDDELVVPSASIIVDRTAQPPTVRWEMAQGVESGSATVTVMATRGSKVVYRAFSAGVTVDGHPISDPLEFQAFDDDTVTVVRPPRQGEGVGGNLDGVGIGDSSGGKTSAAVGGASPDVGLTVVMLLAVLAICGCGLRRACCIKEGSRSDEAASASPKAGAGRKGHGGSQLLEEAEGARLVGRGDGDSDHSQQTDDD